MNAYSHHKPALPFRSQQSTTDHYLFFWGFFKLTLSGCGSSEVKCLKESFSSPVPSETLRSSISFRYSKKGIKDLCEWLWEKPMWIMVARFYLPAGIDCLMPVPCLQVTGEDFERCDERKNRGMAEALGTNFPLYPTGLKTHCNEDSSALSPLDWSPYFALFLNSLPPSSQSPSCGLSSPRLREATSRLKKYSWLVWLMTPQRAIGFFKASVCFSLCLASIFFSPPCLDTVSLSLSSTDLFCLWCVERRAVRVLRDRVSRREVCVQ